MHDDAGLENVYVALGSNLGDRAAHLAFARAALGNLPRTRVVAASDVEETAAIGPAGQAPYLNQMLRLHTALAPHALLDALQRIESDAGRVRAERWGARTLDLDIVRYGERVLRTERLVVPHPELPNRAFWQRQLAQVASRAAQRAVAA